ncbi:acetoacetyl-CoA synthetase [Aspergillus carlsbadensis]|nr:acetoacetyl-CoA synthetase [Aspergillus carlsbadensis]
MAKRGTARKTPVWLPGAICETNISKFMDLVNAKTGLGLKTYDDLYRWSVNPETAATFWDYAHAFLEIGGRLQEQAPRTLFPRPSFFPSEAFNLAELILRHRSDDAVAIYFAREQQPLEKVTWQELRQRTASARSALVNSGVCTGNRVAAVISNSVDAIVLCLATLSIGAIWSSASPDLGVKAVVDRISQVKPKVVFADNGYSYGGKCISLEQRISEWSSQIAKMESGLQHVVVLPTIQGPDQLCDVYKGITWTDFVSKGSSGQPLSFKCLPFDHPAFILFSSGTTGAPKCIVHSAGGAALKVKVDSQLQHDMRPGDVIFQYTTTSWVMWVLNFVNLSNNVSMLLYDGSPFHPAPDVLLTLVEQVGVTVFGTSPRYLAELKSRKIVPKNTVDLSRLRVVTSTGAALPSEMYTWFYETAFPPSTHLISMSGGTDLCGSLVGGTPLLPVYAGEIQAKCLGMAIEVYDPVSANAATVQDGEPGELVCTSPFPSQPLTFYGDGGDEKYRSSYFARFGPRVWCQGDFVQIESDTGGIKMLGRSDGVLNPSGVRFGSSEIYAVVDAFPEIEDSICIGQRREFDEDEAVLLFVVLKPGQSLSSELVRRVKNAIRERYSPRHVPKDIFDVSAIPYTANGKKCEINVKQILNGVGSAVGGSVVNPESLEGYRND